MTVPTIMSSSSSNMEPTGSSLVNGNSHHSPSHGENFDTHSLDSGTQNDLISKYARYVNSLNLLARLLTLNAPCFSRILFEHTRRQMDDAAHSIRARSGEQQSLISRDGHGRGHGRSVVI